MAVNNDEHIITSLACAHRLKTSVCRTATEFKHLRTKLLENLQTIKSKHVNNNSQGSLSTMAIDYCFDDDVSIDDHFQQVSDAILEEHAVAKRPSLVIFGPNSSGKTSFIQRFLGIGNILPSGIGPVTARIVQFTYASADRACFHVYETIEKTSVQAEGNLSHFFENQLQPNWEGITKVIQPHVKRPINIDENSVEFNEWAKCFVELSLPSSVLSLGIDIYDTPGFLSDNREQVLTENLHKLVKRITPTLVFLYDNATISDTDKNCFLAMKDTLGSMERVSVFFLNTKADCISIANDYFLDDDPENVSVDLFSNTLREKRQHCYELLLRRCEMANEALGRLPDSVDECTCFDICTVPGNFDPWETYTNVINTTSFRRIVAFAVEAYSAPTLALMRDMLATVDDYFDLTVSTADRLPKQWAALHDEAIEWGCHFFDEYEKVLPELIDDLVANILHLFEELKPQIAHQAALIKRTEDSIDALLQDNNGDHDIYKLLEAMDAYATLSNETNRRTFAIYCLTTIADEIKQQKPAFGRNLIQWVNEQRKAFNKNVTSNYKYITKHLSDQQKLHNLISQFSGPFAIIECQLLAAEELNRRGGVLPTIGEELGRGGFCSVHTAQWDPENNLAVKKLLCPSVENEQMFALEAHYHRTAARLCSNYLVPLLHLYENNIDDNKQELWLIMPRYSMSLRKYLTQHIHDISFAKVISFALTIAQALAELHRLEIVHRDLKSSNIMLDDNEQCHIIDFGTVKLGLSNRTLLGTAPLPPEMIAAYLQSNSRYITYDGTAADVYSFGLLLYEMLPKLSYEQLNVDTVSNLEKNLLKNSQSDTNTEDYKTQIRACLNENPAKRPSASELVSKLTVMQKRTEIKPCMVCDDRDRTLRFAPCGHKVMCAQCWESWRAISNGNAQCILCKAIVRNQTQDDTNSTYYLPRN
ncbi:unnamed protein product [Rotaria sp. Silwood1]|nr:unnamed protein product [Rotaria sp. Silwood1]CAF1619981.1 unnamed protein product [Rotaria sp. Silwood1]CAF3748454.1 unnamed protein product [Rotaria sp. Silwood1]